MKYFSFKGRAGRQEWWLVWLTASIVGFVVGLGSSIVAGISVASGSFSVGALLAVVVAIVVSFAFFVAYIAASVRRYHDRGKSGWWFFIAFIPLIGWLWQLIELGFFEGTQGDNQYGPAQVSVPVPISEPVSSEVPSTVLTPVTA